MSWANWTTTVLEVNACFSLSGSQPSDSARLSYEFCWHCFCSLLTIDQHYRCFPSLFNVVAWRKEGWGSLPILQEADCVLRIQKWVPCFYFHLYPLFLVTSLCFYVHRISRVCIYCTVCVILGKCSLTPA